MSNQDYIYIFVFKSKKILTVRVVRLLLQGRHEVERLGVGRRLRSRVGNVAGRVEVLRGVHGLGTRVF